METKIKNLAQVIEIKLKSLEYLEYPMLEGISRKVDETHATKIMEGMLTFGAEATSLIIIETEAFGTKIRFIADGNHRAWSAKLLKMPLDIKVVKLTDDTIENVKAYVACLNNSVKRWSNLVYLEVFVASNIREYVKFKQIIEETNYTITDLLQIYCGSDRTKEFQLGKMKFINEADSDKLLVEAKRLKAVLPKHSFTRRAIWRIMKPKFIEGNYKKMSTAIIKYAKANNDFSADEKTFKAQINKIWTDTFQPAE